MAIRSRFENLHRQRQNGGARKDAGHAFVADAGGRLGGKHYSSSSARGRGKGREGRGWGGHRNLKDVEEEEQHKVTSGKAGGGKTDSAKGDSAKCKLAERRDTSPFAALMSSAAGIVIKDIRGRSAPTSSLFLHTRTARALTVKVTRPPGARKRRPFYVTCQASIVMSRMRRGVAICSLGKWGISRLYAIVGHRLTCLTHRTE